MLLRLDRRRRKVPKHQQGMMVESGWIAQDQISQEQGTVAKSGAGFIQAHTGSCLSG